MKKLMLRFWIFINLWGTPDQWADDGTAIDAAFAWALAGPLAEFDDELSHYEELHIGG
jgi:hypothetical protein